MIIIIRIIRAGIRLVSNFFNFSWNPKCIYFRFWIPAKVAEITDERGTNVDYSAYYYYYFTLFQLKRLLLTGKHNGLLFFVFIYDQLNKSKSKLFSN